MRHLSFAILVIFFLVSCAALGSKTKIFDDSKLRSIKTIGLITKRYDQPKNEYHKIIKESFTRTLIEGLEQKKLFRIIVIDTMENEKLKIETINLSSEIDAILVAEWKLINPYNMVTDSKVTLSLLDRSTKQPIATSVHGTKVGNSYMWYPNLPRTLLDATEGAINSLAKNLKK